jgi:hypothetical protein
VHTLLDATAAHLAEYDDLDLRGGMAALLAERALAHAPSGLLRTRPSHDLSPRHRGVLEFLALELVDLAGRVARARGEARLVVSADDVRVVFATDEGVRAFFA